MNFRSQFPGLMVISARVVLSTLLSVSILVSGCGQGADSEQAKSSPDQKPDVDKVEQPSSPDSKVGPVDDRAKTAAVKPKVSDEAFREAALKGNLQLVQQALDSGSDANAADPDGRTALLLASFDGHSGVVRLLLNQKARVNHRDGAGRTALMYAATGPNVETVSMLLDAGAETDVADTAEGFTALMFAAAEGQVEVVKALLARKADATITDKDGDTAQVFAGRNGHTEIAKLLSK